MYIGDFVDLVHRNATYPNIRFIAQSSRSNQGAPANTCTLLAGAWLPVVKTDEPVSPTVHSEHIGAWNVPVPDIPEHTDYDETTGRIRARGWKGLIQMLLQDHVIRPTREIERLCGSDWEQIRRGAGIRCY